MIFQHKIAKFMESDIPALREIGYIIFSRHDKNGGLTYEELQQIVDAVDLLNEEIKRLRKATFEGGHL